VVVGVVEADVPARSRGWFLDGDEVKDGEGWKIKNLTFNLTPPPQK